MVNSLRGDTITAELIPVAWTPTGVVLGDSRQSVGVARSNILEWADHTFPLTDDQAFVASLRDLELLVRVGWHSAFPETLDERSVLNAEDLPEEMLDALTRPRASLVQCAACRRLCVDTDFVWKEKPLCAWDFHSQVFGKRGPWRNGSYEIHHFDTLPQCAYVVPELLEELKVSVLLSLGDLSENTCHALVNALLENERSESHMAVRTQSGIVVLREG